MSPGTDITVATAELLEFLRRAILIRRFDQLALELRLAGRIEGVVHPYIGQEAVAVGVIAALEDSDEVVSHHRGHGHCIARGIDLDRMLGELLGKAGGVCAGKGGSMHIADYDRGIIGANGIVGAGLPIGVGAALAARLRGADSVVVVFFGDGATGQGVFHEALNYSAISSLPIVWVCENNRYAAGTPLDLSLARAEVAPLAAGYGIPAESLDGADAIAIRAAAETAVEHARRGDGPALLECHTHRWGRHAQRGVPIPETRPPELLEEGRRNDPIRRLEERLRELGVDDAELAAIDEAAAAELAAALEAAERMPDPDPAAALADAYV